MGFGPSEGEAAVVCLDLNSAVAEQPETLTSPVGLGTGGLEIGVAEDEQADAERDNSEKKGAGDASVLGEADETNDARDGVVAGEVEVETLRLDNDVVDDKSVEIGGGEDDDVRVGKQDANSKRRRGRPRKSVVVRDEKKYAFNTTDLVWGKVRSHPWWPAQIFDPSRASEMASSIQKRDNYLVAYFGDKTFAWCDESQLKPFQMYFSQMEKQNNMDSFVSAVSVAIQEVSRRIQLGMTCRCFMDEGYANIKEQKFENAGLREEIHSYAVDEAAIVNSFDPVRLIDYLKTLAQFAFEEFDELELSIAKSQLKAFYRSKGHSDLPIFLIGESLGNDMEASPSKKIKPSKVVDAPAPTTSDSASGKGKSRRKGSSVGKDEHLSEHARKRRSLSPAPTSSDSASRKGRTRRKGSSVREEKHVSEHSRQRRSLSPASTSSGSASGKGKSRGKRISIGKEKRVPEHSRKKRSLSELMEKETDHLEADDKMSLHSSERKHDDNNYDVADTVISKKKKLDSLGDLVATSHTPNPQFPSKFGERMRRVAGQLTGSPSTLSCNGEVTTKSPKKASHTKRGIKDVVNQKRVHQVMNSDSLEYSSAEMLSQLCLVARNPLQEYDFVYKIQSFINDFRRRVLYSDGNITGTVDAKRGRKKSRMVRAASPEENDKVASSEQKTEEPKRKQQKLIPPEDEPAVSFPLGSMSDTGQQDDSADQAGIQKLAGTKSPTPAIQDNLTNPNNMRELDVNLNEVDECMPTALVLTFNDSDAIPAEADLISIFGKYGPLREEDTEVSKSENNAKVVFKKRSDAELALSSAGKNSVFGHTLVSYRLRCLDWS